MDLNLSPIHGGKTSRAGVQLLYGMRVMGARVRTGVGYAYAKHVFGISPYTSERNNYEGYR
jgi:hypothetical protein